MPTGSIVTFPKKTATAILGIAVAGGVLIAGVGPLLGRHLVHQRQKVQKKARLIALDLSKPSFENLLRFSQDPQNHLVKDQLYPYIDYYENVVAAFPDIKDVYGILGFCYYHTGRTREAIEAYKISLTGNPSFFWSWYNLGVIYYQNGNTPRAVQVWQKALKADPALTLKAIYLSKAYQQILQEHPELAEDVIANLRSAFNICARLVDGAAKGKLKKEEKLVLRVF
jgi:tetratricopeptide (TPR) repeat protein